MSRNTHGRRVKIGGTTLDIEVDENLFGANDPRGVTIIIRDKEYALCAPPGVQLKAFINDTLEEAGVLDRV